MLKYFKYPYMGRIRGLFMGSINSIVLKPLQISYKHIKLGRGVFIHKHARIEAVCNYMGDVFDPQIVIGNGVSIQQNLHLTCAQKIEIGADTSIASNVTISDIDHPYNDINLPVDQQKIIVKPIFIGSQCKIYNNAVILQGVKLGRHCVIGANSVVTQDIGDYCVAVGAPAKAIKQYNLETKTWEKVN